MQIPIHQVSVYLFFNSLLISIPLCNHTQKYPLSIFLIVNMTRQFQQPTLFSDVANKINHMVYISIVVTTFDPSSAARHCRLQLPLQHDIFNHLYACNDLLQELLTQLYIPMNFILDHDCDQVPNIISTRLLSQYYSGPVFI